MFFQSFFYIFAKNYTHKINKVFAFYSINIIFIKIFENYNNFFQVVYLIFLSLYYFYIKILKYIYY